MSDFNRPIDIAASGRVTYGLDDGLMVEFYIKPTLVQAKSDEQAHPVYADRIHTRIVSPGNTKTTWDYLTKGVIYSYDEDGQVDGYLPDYELPVDQCDPVRFPKAWDRFAKKGQKVTQGWDITQWSAINRSFAETLKAQNIHTVEALAALTDASATNVMGGLKWRNLAKAALSEAETLSLATAEQERANKAEEANKVLQSQIDGMKAELAALTRKKSA